MASWEKTKIKINDAEVEAQAPVIISASRSTDIPAFYSDWLVNRIEQGYVKWTNPFNGVPLYVSFEKTRLFVFWTKNPKAMLDKLGFFEKRGFSYYFQFTLNDYDDERLEPGVPGLESRIDTFIKLSQRLGKNRVIWRFDPLILTDKISVDDLLGKVKKVGNAISPYTSRFVFSFSDITAYAKVARNLRSAGIQAREFTTDEMNMFAKGLSLLNMDWKLQLGTCAEQIDLEAYGIEHNRCIDDRLIAKEFQHDNELMRFLGLDPQPVQGDLFNSKPNTKKKNLTDAGQREACGCIISKDIGEYNTCPHLCAYCYANTSGSLALANYKRHLNNPLSGAIRE
jgi:hypothetical protein